MRQAQPADLASPPPSQAPYWDESRGAWVLSRYRDVIDALRDPQLWPVAARGEDQAATRDDAGRLRLRGASQDALSAVCVAEWKARIEPLARAALDRLATDRPVDLLEEFALPWCQDVAFLVVGAAAENRERLAALGREVFAGTGEPDDSEVRAHASAATAELVSFFEKGPMPMGEPTFVALSQTSPRLLGNMTLALYQHPGEVERLRKQPDLLPGAVEELLRYAGIVRRIWRQARGAVDLGGVTIADGQRVMLLLASANRDPEQFHEPDRLDVIRRVTGQLTLGMGRNSCVGAALIRMMAGAVIGALVEKFPQATVCSTPEWRIGSGYAFPTSVPLLLCHEAHQSFFT